MIFQFWRYLFKKLICFQQLGGSNSAYSLASHQDLDERYNATWEQVSDLVSKMRNEWNVLSICDIVLNHAANESTWVFEDPTATYNMKNCPHLRPAFMLDQALAKVSFDIEDGLVDGVPKGVLSECQHFLRLTDIIKNNYVFPLKLHEFFQADIDEQADKFAAYQGEKLNNQQLKLLPDPERKRLGAQVDFRVARSICGSDVNHFRSLLRDLNAAKEAQIQNDIHYAVDNVLKGARYERLDPNGPKLTACGRKTRLATPYFTSKEGANLKELENLMYTDEGAKFMAHNGWVMGSDPTTDFASAECEVYFKRELVAWGDSVKLNYGKKPEDSSFLWSYMKKYVEKTAKVFDGIRLDNCHSTPIHVAEYLIDAARKVRPNLYVIAELFTGSEHQDNVYINHLGITSLIREALNAWDSREQGRLVHRYGGEPVGAFVQPQERPLAPSMAHAIFFDQTHDNPSPVQKRTLLDMLPSSALVGMSCCAVGSNRGYDELVPHHIHVVNESRLYKPLQEVDRGILSAKKVINDLHFYMAKHGFDQLYVDQMSPHVVGVTRHSPTTHESIVTVVSTCFYSGVGFSPMELRVEGKLVKVWYEACLRPKSEHCEFEKQEDLINGTLSHETYLKTSFDLDKSELARLRSADGDVTVIDLHNLQPGSAISFHFKLPENQEKASNNVFEILRDDTELQEICANLNLNDLNRVLYRCDQEEREDGCGGVYVLDGFCPAYAGLQGFMTLLAKIRPINDLGNWLPKNLRDGDWLMDYMVGRLKRGSTRCQALGEWLDRIFGQVKQVPSYLKPKLFDLVYSVTYTAVLDQTWTLMSPFVKDGSAFVKFLAMGSVQHAAELKSSPLPKLSAKLQIDFPRVSCAAGLPHFSTGYMRNWGRDTFISLPGLFLITGRHQEARVIILSFAGCLRHGLIPNLLDGGNARFNCRDAFWWWLHCIKLYAEQVPHGHHILKDPVARLFPTDDQWQQAQETTDQPLEDVIHEGLQKHFQGLKFRELRAGRQIDEHMTDEGFNNEIGVNPDTGFVFGGNVWNCGTWMDKMGSSDNAGNRGKPSTPRDGSAVELVGLSYACLKWLAEEHGKGHYAHEGVSKPGLAWSLNQWADKIEQNFDLHFFVRKDSPIDPNIKYINKENIYKDTLNSGLPWTDYQLRCNFPIAMAVAPDLFVPEHAWQALQIVKNKLLGPLGIATLDPDDWAYRGSYDNSNGSHDPAVAHGANYHQGPEWLWPVGFFLRAWLRFNPGPRKDVKNEMMQILSKHYVEIQTSGWKGLPELTNEKGKFCKDSNPTQAWSFATLLEVLNELQ